MRSKAVMDATKSSVMGAVSFVRSFVTMRVFSSSTMRVAFTTIRIIRRFAGIFRGEILIIPNVPMEETSRFVPNWHEGSVNQVVFEYVPMLPGAQVNLHLPTQPHERSGSGIGNDSDGQ